MSWILSAISESGGDGSGRGGRCSNESKPSSPFSATGIISFDLKTAFEDDFRVNAGLSGTNSMVF